MISEGERGRTCFIESFDSFLVLSNIINSLCILWVNMSKVPVYSLFLYIISWLVPNNARGSVVIKNYVTNRKVAVRDFMR
jgi:hypothetical protein